MTRKKWCELYKKLTGYEATMRPELPFREFADLNIKWLRDHIEDTAQRLERAMYEQ